MPLKTDHKEASGAVGHAAGPAKMNAAQALKATHVLNEEQKGPKKASPSAEKESKGMGFYADFATVALTGITNDQADAIQIDAAVTGEGAKYNHGYAAYGENKLGNEKYGHDFKSEGDKKVSGPLGDKLDIINDVAAVTQYAAAADKAVLLNKGPDGKPQVQIDWAALSKMEVSADMGMLGGQVKYDSPHQVADNGYATVLQEMEKKGLKTDDKNQFISLTGHSGGGQSSFYTALKLASEGYKNVSLVGVDMAMTPHQREVLQALGVQVTNITSHNTGADGKRTDSEVGQGVQFGMGGGQNYYDLNVQRQTDPGMQGRHSLANDANVLTMVRFSQYLDSIGQHGKYSPEQYDAFLKATTVDGKSQGNLLNGVPADQNVLSTTIDQRGLPGPEANSTDPSKANNFIEKIVNTLPVLGDKVNGGIDAVGKGIENKFDKAGDKAQSGIGGFFDRIGNVVGGGVNKLIDGVGNAVDNGFDKAGDAAESWLGHIPLVGGFLGKAANKGLDWVGDKIGGGIDKVGDAAQNGISNFVHNIGQTVGGGVNNLIDGVGKGIGNAFDKVGDFAGSVTNGALGWGVGKLQGIGIDLSHIKSLSGFSAGNPSVQRGWENVLTPPSEQNDPTKFQTIPVPGAEAAKVQTTYPQDFKAGLDAKLGQVKDLKPEQQQVVVPPHAGDPNMCPVATQGAPHLAHWADEPLTLQNGSVTPAMSLFPQASPSKPKSEKEQVDEAVAASQASLTPKGGFLGFGKDVAGRDATGAMDTLLGLPPNLQGKAIAQMDREAFGFLLSKVPPKDRERFKTLVDNTEDPDRKLQLFAEYHKAHVENDAKAEREKTQDEGSWLGGRTSEQQGNQRKNEQRDKLVQSSKHEVDEETAFLRERAQGGKLSANDINKYMLAKETEHKGEMSDLTERAGTLEGTSDDDRVEFVKRQTEKNLKEEGWICKGVPENKAKRAMDELRTLPPDLQGKAIEKMDEASFDRFVKQMPEEKRDQFSELLKNTQDPERKLRLWGEAHKAQAHSDANKEHEKTKDEGNWYSRSEGQTENRRINKRRDEIVKGTEKEADEEVDYLRDMKKNGGTITTADVDRLMRRKDREHQIEMKYNINLTNKSGTRKYNINPSFAQGSKIAWSEAELDQVESGLSRMPIGHVRGNKAIVEVQRSDIDPDDEKAMLADPTYKAKYGGDHLNNVIRVQDLGVTGTYRHTGESREISDPAKAGHGGATISPVEETIIHEFGHDIHNQNPKIFEEFKKAGGWTGNTHDPGRIPDPAIAPLSGTPNDNWRYARTRPGEHFAETYMKAILKPQSLAQDLLDAPKARVQAEQRKVTAAMTVLENLKKANPPVNATQIQQAEAQIKDAEANQKAAQDDCEWQAKQFEIMRNQVFHSDTAQADAQKRLLQKGVPADKIEAFVAETNRASTPDQIALIEQRYAP
ncbi:MAG TPA: hypothetical protein PKE31_18280 [Pseudomonadota bacterium]|nr:hypothetical protein [Pseudomonadota bacterium]